MKYTITEISEKNKREYSPSELWFSVYVIRKISPYLAWLFLNLRFKGYHVLFLCAFVELVGVFLLAIDNPLAILGGVTLLFFGFVLDHVDGDVRRVLNESRAWCIYFDRMMHRIIYPGIYIALGVNFYFKFNNNIFLWLGISAAMFNSLTCFNKIYKIVILGDQQEKVTPTRLVRDKLEQQMNNKLLFSTIFILKRIYDHMFCNWVQYIFLSILTLIGQPKFFIIFYGFFEPINWIVDTILGLKFGYFPDRKYYQNG